MLEEGRGPSLGAFAGDDEARLAGWRLPGRACPPERQAFHSSVSTHCSEKPDLQSCLARTRGQRVPWVVLDHISSLGHQSHPVSPWVRCDAQPGRWPRCGVPGPCLTQMPRGACTSEPRDPRSHHASPAPDVPAHPKLQTAPRSVLSVSLVTQQLCHG